MSWKDRITVTVSVTALMISVTSSYFTFFRVETALSSAVLGVALNQAESTATVNVAVLNTGNRQVALIDATPYLIQMDGDEALRQPMTRVQSENGSFPVLVEPGKLVLFELKAELPWQSVIAYRQEVEPGDDHTHKTIMGVNFYALGATGVRLTGVNDAVKIELRDTSYGGSAVNSDITSFVPVPRRSK